MTMAEARFHIRVSFFLFFLFGNPFVSVVHAFGFLGIDSILLASLSSFSEPPLIFVTDGPRFDVPCLLSLFLFLMA